MKNKIKLLLGFAILSLLSSCNIDSLINNNDTKSLVILSPNFVETSVQLIIKDPLTNDFSSNNLLVKLISNKKIVDLNGRYTDTFNVSNGLLEFAVDPNETVSSSDPLSILAFIANTSNNGLSQKNIIINNKGHNNIIAFEPTGSLTETNKGESSQKIGDMSLSFIPKNPELWVGDKDIFSQLFKLPHEDPYGEAITYLTRDFYLDVFHNEEVNLDHFNGTPSDLNVKVNFKDPYAVQDSYYNLEIIFIGGNYHMLDYRINKNGTYIRRGVNVLNKIKIPTELSSFSNYAHEITIPENVYIGYFYLEYIYAESNISTCDTGYTFNFNGVDQDTALGLEYKITRDSGTIAAVGMTSLTSSARTHRVSDIDIDKTANTIEFLDNEQYYISPKTFDLGGSENCGKTFDFTLTPKENHNKYKVNFQTQCEGESVAYAANLSAFYREAGSSANWNSVRFEKGSSILYLDPSKTYEVKSSYNDTDINFKFKASEENISSLISQNLSSFNDLKDFEFSMDQIDGENVINLKLIFKSGSCPMND